MRSVVEWATVPTKLAAGLKFLFANHAEITVDYDFNRFYIHPTGCQLVSLIRQVQCVHPDLQVGFVPNGQTLTLTLGKVSFKQEMNLAGPCNNGECPGCAVFYPTVLFRIERKAYRLEEGEQPEQMHLANARLDRCRIDSVADHLGGYGWWKALEAQMNEAQDLVTITFKRLCAGAGPTEFNITADCGQCLSNSCFGCLYVE